MVLRTLINYASVFLVRDQCLRTAYLHDLCAFVGADVRNEYGITGEFA